MTKGRLEAFSDGVLAIIITIMVLELHVPRHADPASLRLLLPVFMSYALSFVYLAIYWNNHHHMFQAVTRVDGRVLWANLHLLFWLSLVPFVTGWIGQTHFSAFPVALYGCVLMFAAIAYYILVRTLVSLHGADSVIARAIGRDFKGKISIVFYVVAMPLAYLRSFLALSLIVIVAIVWLVPDRRFEKTLGI